jgi:RNA polymerase sigma-70 factor, ECF subfamily
MITVIADKQGSISDRELVLKCQRGDYVAFRYLYRRYQPKIRSTLYQLCGLESLDDFVQEVFLRVWRGLPKLRSPEYFSTWVYRITWNVATDGRRQLAKRPIGISKTTDEENPLESEYRPQDTPDLMQLHYEDLVRRGLEILGLEHRAVLILHDLEDLPQKEIAQILEIPVGTVKSRLHHARKAMGQFLQKQGVL